MKVKEAANQMLAASSTEDQDKIQTEFVTFLIKESLDKLPQRGHVTGMKMVEQFRSVFRDADNRWRAFANRVNTKSENPVVDENFLRDNLQSFSPDAAAVMGWLELEKKDQEA